MPNSLRAEQEATTVTRALALPDAAAPIQSPDDYNRRLEAWRDHAHILTPAVQMSGGFAPGFQLVASVVRIDAALLDQDTGRGIDTYVDRSFVKATERALNKIGLEKIARAAGLVWTERTGRRDDRRTLYLWEYFAEGEMWLPDGQAIPLIGSVEVDLRDGAAQIGGWTPEGWRALVAKNATLPKGQQDWYINGWSEKRVIQARRFGLQLAESKAKNRAIRSLGLRQTYTVKELEKPFLVLRAVYLPDTRDPEIRRLVAERALYGRRQLYAAPTQVLPPVDAIQQSVESAQPSVDPPARETPPTPAPPDTAGPAEGDADEAAGVHIDSVRKREGTTQGRAWTLYILGFDDGSEATTFDRELADSAGAIKQAGTAIVPEIETDAQGRRTLLGWQVGEQGTLPMDADDEELY